MAAASKPLNNERPKWGRARNDESRSNNHQLRTVKLDRLLKETIQSQKKKMQSEPETKIEENLSPQKRAKTKSLKIAKTNTNWSRSEIIFDKKSK
jgi:hypothetical protein